MEPGQFEDIRWIWEQPVPDAAAVGDLLEEREIRSLLLVPLLFEGKPVGALVLGSQEPGLARGQERLRGLGALLVRHSPDQQRNKSELLQRSLQEGQLQLERMLAAIDIRLRNEEGGLQ